jgi:hypothetical protein
VTADRQPRPAVIEVSGPVMLRTADAARFQALRARAQARGAEVHALNGHGAPAWFIAAKWALVARFSNLDHLAEWVEKLDGSAQA